MVRAWRAAAQPGPDGRARSCRRPPATGLGAGDRAGRGRAGGARRAAGRRPLGTRRAGPAAPARRRAARAERPSLTVVGAERLLRLQALQPGQRPPAAAGVPTARLVPLITDWSESTGAPAP